ncbi:MAG: aldo/keto reductase [Leptospiraceae bacterium]|nr:aldo/keto reductase [Leptospiraceae bacterium]
MSESENLRISRRIFGSLIQSDELSGKYESGPYFERLKSTYTGYEESAWQIAAGSTGWKVSRLGMGTYRMQRDSREHYDALREALISGTNVIDTSANYMDGSAESLIGDVLRDLIKVGRLKREDVLIVTKAGYIQGRNALLSAEIDFPEQTVFDRSLAHCIHPDFLDNQIELSRMRMGLQTLDVVLLHNPEYFLKKAQRDKQPQAEAASEYYRRIHKAFDFLEEARKEGRIQYYGISSNTFPVYGQYESTDLNSIGGQKYPGFRVIQFPANLIERGFREGSLCRTAKERNLWTLANRPFNAFQSKIGLLRLAGSPAEDSDEIIQGMINLEEEMQDLEFRIQGELAAEKFHFDQRFPAAGAVIRYYLDRLRNPEQAHAATAALSPVLQKTITHLYGRAELMEGGEQESLKRLLEQYVRKINNALASLERNVRARHHRFTRALADAIAERIPDLGTRDLSSIALQYLLASSCPATALCGMRRVSYVRQLHAMYNDPAPSRFRDGLPGLEQRALELWSKEFGF